MTARYRSRIGPMIAAVTLGLGALWCVHHALMLVGAGGVPATRYAPLYALMFGSLMWQWSLAFSERPFRITPRKARQLADRNVVGIVPAYNEDPAALRACVLSMLGQSRLPQVVVVIDDGSTNTTYDEIKAELIRVAEDVGVRLIWQRQRNAGKRHAQVAAVDLTPEADFYWTVDSDTISDRNALDELLIPFADQRVMSSAGIVLSANARRALLTRVTDLIYVTSQLLDRSALSRLRSVWVNSGPIAVYRAHILRDNADGYLSETFRGQQVPYSDDSYLTLCAMMAGATVQQPTAFCFSLMPETFGNHFRQFDRWMRGSFIRSLWRMKYLQVGRLPYWLHLYRWAQLVAAAVLMCVVAYALTTTSINWQAAVWLAGVPLFIGYANNLRYLAVKRSDQSAGYQVGTWLLSPLAVVWQMTFMRGIRWWSASAVLLSRSRMRWGTRETVEVSLGATS